MSRRAARENLFKLIYERSVIGEKNALTFNLVYNATEEAQKEYFQSAYIGIDEKFGFLKRLIAGFSAEFKAERIYKVDLAILLLASYEILFNESVPDAAAVNEAVEIAKVYSTERSAAFINGILASIIKNKQEIIERERTERENGLVEGDDATDGAVDGIDSSITDADGKISDNTGVNSDNIGLTSEIGSKNIDDENINTDINCNINNTDNGGSED